MSSSSSQEESMDTVDQLFCVDDTTSNYRPESNDALDIVTCAENLLCYEQLPQEAWMDFCTHLDHWSEYLLSIARRNFPQFYNF